MVERPARVQRSGSLSSLNDDVHGNDVMRRKMTVLDVQPISAPPVIEDNHPMKKLNDDLTRITINYLNDHLAELTLPKTTLVCLPREVRRHHVNNSWLADEKILYQIKSFDFNQFSKVKEALAKLTNDFDDTMKNRYRRYTDGNRGGVRLNREVDILATCQDDLHVQPLGKLIFSGTFGEQLTIRVCPSFSSC